MTYQELWRSLVPTYDPREAQAIARWVLEVGMGMTTTDIYLGKVSELSADDHRKLEEIRQRLLNLEPVQYILGTAEFCGRAFQVQPGVLIPRPETQQLIPMLAPCTTTPFTLLDIGTGSGCIAITAALEYGQAQVSACDLSAIALEVARKNATSLGAHVNFSLQDALHMPHDMAQWDVIVSNPPYICEQERQEMSDNVRLYEPAMALFVPDDDPLRFYRAIALYALHALRPQGRLLFEINPYYAATLQQLLTTMGYSNVVLHDDAFGRCRFATAHL